MAEAREAFIGIDAAKRRNAVAVADAGREGEVRFFGEVDASPESMRPCSSVLICASWPIAPLPEISIWAMPDRTVAGVTLALGTFRSCFRPPGAVSPPRSSLCPLHRRGRGMVAAEEAMDLTELFWAGAVWLVVLAVPVTVVTLVLTWGQAG
jgi:hypothetical protein